MTKNMWESGKWLMYRGKAQYKVVGVQCGRRVSYAHNILCANTWGKI